VQKRKGRALAVTNARPEGPRKQAVSRHKAPKALLKGKKEQEHSQGKSKLLTVFRAFLAMGFVEGIARLMGLSAAEALAHVYQTVAALVL
jgi:hypothetical protein